MDAKELKEKIDLVVSNYNTKSNNNTEYSVVSVMNQINDLIGENGAFYKMNEAENPLIYDLFYLNSVLKWNKSQKHKISLINTYFDEEIYKVSMNKNIFNFLPKSKISNVDKVNIKSYDSSDKSFKDLVSNFSSKDELRPFMQVTNFNSLGIVSTDAHKLLFLSKKDNKLEKDENKCISDFCLKHQEKFPSSFENIRYPNWKAVIPQKEINPFDIVVDTDNLRMYLQICFNFGFFLKNYSELVVDFRFKNEENSEHIFYRFNLGFLIESVEALLKLGVKKTKIHFGVNSRGVVFTDAENKEIDFINQNFILLMPLISDESSIFMFDFESNSVLYADKKYEFPFPIEDSIKEQPIQIKEEELTKEEFKEKNNPASKKEETLAESKTENDEDYDVRLDDNVTMLVESKVDESNIADNKKQKIKDFLYAILNKNKEFIVNGKNEIDKVIAWFSDLTSNPTSTKILFEIIREKQPKTQKAVDEFLRNYIGLGAKEKKWLTKNEVIDIVNRNIGEYVFISNSKRDWVAGRKSYPHEPTNLMYLVKIDGNNVLYKYENNPSTYQTHIDSIRDIVVEGKSSVNDKKLEGIVASLFEVKSVAPVKEEVKITKEIVKEKWGLPAKEKRDWLDSLNEKDYQFAVTEMANISVDAVSESKKETHIESKSEALKDIDTSNMNFAQIVYNSNPNKFKKFKDLEWFKLKPNQKLVVVINSNENRIIYEKIHNGLKYVNSFVTDKLMKDPNLIKEFGDRVSYVAFDIDTLKKNNRIGFGVDYEYFKIKGLLEDLNDYFEANKHKEEQLLKTKFPEDKRLIKGNEYYLWTKTRGDSSNPNNFHKYIYNGLLHNANKYAYGSENVYQFSNEHTSTHIAYEKMDNTFVNTEIYSVDDFNKWKKSYEEKNNPVTKIKETPTESKSDLEFLNEMLQTSKDLLDLISDTGSKEDIDFLKSKIEVTENLISLLDGDEVVKKKTILLAPNGKPSNLTPEQYKLVRTPEFKAWFGDFEKDPANASKVVDENGEPLICYHGAEVSYNERFYLFNKGSYFTDNFNSARYYSLKLAYGIEDVKEENTTIYECFLSIKKPKTFDYKNEDAEILFHDFDENDKRIKEYESNGYNGIIWEYDYVMYDFRSSMSEKDWNNFIKTWENNPLKQKQDIDDFWKIKETKKENHFIIFNPNQIKLADGSNTTFDGNNPDIRFAGGGGVSEKEKQEWKKFVLDNSSWFDDESRDNDDDNEILLTTRRNGNTSYDEVGQMDLDEANDIAKKVKYKFPKTEYNIETVDEYVYLYLRPTKTEKELEQEKAIKKIKDEQNKSAKLITEKLSIPNEKALEIIKSFSYSKEYFEKYKNVDADKYNNSFRVYFSIGSPTNIDFDNAEQVFDYITKDDFIKSIYNRSNPRNEVLVGLYGWDSLRIKFSKQGRPILPNGKTDWSKEGYVLQIFPFIETNIENEKDFIEKVKKVISDFIASYKIYVLNDYESEKETPAESKSDLDFLNEMLQTSKDLLDLISDTGSKEDIDFLKEKIETIKDLISLLGINEFKKYNSILLAPNGKPSNLTPEQYKLVRTPEFKAWFGDFEKDPANASKVVDENGEPMQMYHKTDNNKFTIFDKEKLGDSSGWETAYLGFYFGNKYQKGSYGKKTIKCFLNIKNPFLIKTEYYADFDYEYKRKSEPLLMDNFFNKNKYDGILIDVEKLQKDETMDKVFVAFEPEQIKLSDGTNTTFDGNNPDIRYAGGGGVSENVNKLNVGQIFEINRDSEKARKYFDNSYGKGYLFTISDIFNKRIIDDNQSWDSHIKLKVYDSKLKYIYPIRVFFKGEPYGLNFNKTLFSKLLSDKTIFFPSDNYYVEKESDYDREKREMKGNDYVEIIKRKINPIWKSIVDKFNDIYYLGGGLEINYESNEISSSEIKARGSNPYSSYEFRDYSPLLSWGEAEIKFKNSLTKDELESIKISYETEEYADAEEHDEETTYNTITITKK